MAEQSAAPALGLFLSEPARSVLDLTGLLLATPWLRNAPRGDGHPVLVLPGLLATDASTWALRRFVSHLGYPVYGWGLGRNQGPTAAIVAGIPGAVRRLADDFEQPVSLIGWSLGGIFARQQARATPDLVRQVITLGSPFGLSSPAQTRAHPAFARYSDRHVTGIPPPDSRPLPVPSTSVYSRADGIVAWQTCREGSGPQRESIAVRSSHLGFGHHPAVMWLVADRLAQHRDSWQPFVPPADMRALYPADQATAE
jgi:pimeloyl-ACP methyl ester carboxylesterase